jgi:hypothetical protein
MTSDGRPKRPEKKIDGFRNFGALHELEKMETELSDMEMELDLFLSSKNG